MPEPHDNSDLLITELESLIGPGLMDRDVQTVEVELELAEEDICSGLPARFQLKGLVGSGGMGRVFDALDRSLGRRVAIKVLHRRNPIAAELMRREREVLAALAHPGIVAVYDCGELPDGQPYFVMQFAEGEDLASYVECRQLGIPAIVALVSQIARAVGVAHLLQIVHRDLKPKNIAVSADGHPLVLDFGLAKFTHLAETAGDAADAVDDHTVTLGRIKGTLAYMSPEQAAGETVDCRTDVYALGVILFQLISGKVPIDPTASALEPGKWLETLRRHSAPPLERTKPGVPREVAAIVARCLQSEPKRRYANALELADDLDAFLSGRPVAAVEHHRPLYVARKFMQMHRLAIGVAGLFLLTLTVVIGMAFVRIQQERNIAVAERQRAEDREAIARPFLYASEIRQAGLEWKNLRLGAATRLLDEQIPAPGQKDLRSFDWYFLRSQCAKQPATLMGHAAGVTALSLSPDETLLASADRSGEICLWSLVDRDLRRRLSGPAERISALAYSPDGGRLAAACDDEAVWLYDLETGMSQRLQEGGAPQQAVRFSPDGQWLAAGDREGFLYLWSTTSLALRSKRQLLGGREILSLDFSPDSRGLAVSGKSAWATILEISEPENSFSLGPHGGPVHAIRFSPDGRYVATAGWDRSLRYWDRDKEYALAHEETVGAEAPILSFEIPSNSRFGYMVLANGRVPVCQLPNRYWSDRTLRVETEKLTSFAATREGTLVSTDGSHRISIHTPEELNDCRILGSETLTQRLAIAPDGASVATSTGNRIALRDPGTGELLAELTTQGAEVNGIGFSSDSTGLVSLDVEGNLIEWDLHSHSQRRQYKIAGAPFACLAIAPNDESVALGGIGTVQVVDLESGAIVWKQKKHGHMLVNAVAYSPNGQLLLSGSWDNTVKVWDASSGALLRTLSGNDEAIFGVAVSYDSAEVAAISRNGVTVVWDIATGERLHTFAEARGSEGGICFSPDGHLLALCSHDPLDPSPSPVVLYDLRTRVQTLKLLPPARLARHIHFTPDGRRLIAAGQCFPDATHGSVFAWDAEAVQGSQGASEAPALAPSTSSHDTALTREGN